MAIDNSAAEALEELERREAEEEKNRNRQLIRDDLITKEIEEVFRALQQTEGKVQLPMIGPNQPHPMGLAQMIVELKRDLMIQKHMVTVLASIVDVMCSDPTDKAIDEIKVNLRTKAVLMRDAAKKQQSSIIQPGNGKIH